MWFTKCKVLTGVVVAVAVAGVGTGALTYNTFAAGQEGQPQTQTQAPDNTGAPPVNVFTGAAEPERAPSGGGSAPMPGAAWRERAVLTGAGDRILSVSFSPDGKLLAGASLDGIANLWDVGWGTLVRALRGESGGQLFSAAISPDGTVLATGGGERGKVGNVRLWDLRTGKLQGDLRLHTDVVGSVAFAPDGRLLVSGSRDGTVRVWNVTETREERTLKGHDGAVLGLAFSPDGKRLATAGGEEVARVNGKAGQVRLWDVESGKVLAVMQGTTGTVSAVAFSPDGQTLASGGADKVVRVWDATTGEAVRQFGQHDGFIRRVAFSPDGKLLASTDTDGGVRLWDVATGRLLAFLRGTVDGSPGTVAFSPDGRLLAVGGGTGKGGYVVIWERVENASPLPAARQVGQPPRRADRLEQLLQDMLRSQRGDEQVLEGLFLATLGRYPTETERKFVLDSVHKHKDRSEAFDNVLTVLTSSREFRVHVEGLEKRLPAATK